MMRRVVTLAALFVMTCLLGALAEEPWSGLEPGGSMTPYHPLHHAGPDRGTRVCPV